MAARRVIVVTGASGTTGSLVARALKLHHDSHITVRMLVRSAAKQRDLAKYGEVHEGDLSDEASLREAFKGAHGLFLLTPFSPQAPQLAQNAIKAAQAAKIEFLLRMSSLGSSKGAKVPVAKDHGVTDEAVKASGIPFTILQPSFFMQNLFNYNGKALKSGEFFGASGGKGPYGAIHAADTGDVAATILADPEQHVKKSYLLTGPEAVTDEGIANMASMMWGRPIKYTDLAMDAFKAKLIENGVPEFQASNASMFEQAKKSGMAKGLSLSVMQILGRQGRTMAEYLEEIKKANLV
jgi:uncharacterized protein YbjT (DUF2867 family)